MIKQYTHKTMWTNNAIYYNAELIVPKNLGLNM